MDKSKAKEEVITGAEWFGIPIATLALAQIYILLFQHYNTLVYKNIAEFFTLLGLVIFVLIFIIWIYTVFESHETILTHWDNLTRLSFIALIPIIGFVLNFQLLYYYGSTQLTAFLSLFNFGFEYALALLIGILLGYRLYTKEIEPSEINYVIAIPPLSIGTSVFLGSYLISISHKMGWPMIWTHYIYFLLLMGLGIFFFLYIFIGSLALSGHVETKIHEVLPTTMLPVGIASLIIINLTTFVGLNGIKMFYFSPDAVGMISIMLWGFEVWNFLVALTIIISKPHTESISVWAYGFPLGLFAVSTIKIMQLTNFGFIFDVFLFIAFSLNVLWVYGWVNTANFLKKSKK